MNKNTIITCFFCMSILGIGNSNAHSPADTVKPNVDEEVNQRIVKNLDSMLNLWYVENSVDVSGFSGLEKPETSHLTSEDSIFMSRLQSLPSVVDLAYNNTIRNYLDVYLVKKKEQVEVMLGLTRYYFPIFEDIFDSYGVPTELKYMAVIESALNPRAVSWAGASGLWQFMYGTGKVYDLKVNSFVDERRDPIKSTHAAAKYLRDLYNIYEDWVLVIAAYNCGPGNVNRAIHRTGGKKNYWDIYYLLPYETRGYVPAYIAAMYAMNYYEEHGLQPRKIEMPVIGDTIQIKEQLHLQQVADLLDIPVDMIRDMNPQYKKDIIPGKYGEYYLKLPLEHTKAFIELEDSIYAYKDSVYFNTIKNENPKKFTSSYYDVDPPAGTSKVIYTVKTGDNLGYIAEWYNVRLSDLRYWNHIAWNLIKSGQKLTIYVPTNKVSFYQRIDNMTFAQKQQMIGKTVEKEETEEDEGNYTYEYYTVKSGDTLWEIAKKFPGVTDTDIMRVNNISNASKISPGQVLKIKKKG